jgi:hypothetical protein
VRRILLAVLAPLAAPPAWAADPPRYVAGPASGYQYDCQQAKQNVPAISTLVTAIPDLDGDGLPEHVIDPGKGCAANRLLYCNDTEGCSISVWLSSWSGVAERFKARSWTATTSAMTVTTGGTACGAAAACTLTYRWTGARLLPMQ